MKRIKVEHILALVAVIASAYLGVHKLYREVQPAIIPLKGLSEKELRRARHRPTRRHWSCLVQMVVLELVVVGAVFDLVLLLR